VLYCTRILLWSHILNFHSRLTHMGPTFFCLTRKKRPLAEHRFCRIRQDVIPGPVAPHRHDSLWSVLITFNKDNQSKQRHYLLCRIRGDWKKDRKKKTKPKYHDNKCIAFVNSNKSNQNDAKRLCSIESTKRRLHRQAIKSKLILTSAQTRTHIFPARKSQRTRQ